MRKATFSELILVKGQPWGRHIFSCAGPLCGSILRSQDRTASNSLHHGRSSRRNSTRFTSACVSVCDRYVILYHNSLRLTPFIVWRRGCRRGNRPYKRRAGCIVLDDIGKASDRGTCALPARVELDGRTTQSCQGAALRYCIPVWRYIWILILLSVVLVRDN